MYIISVIVIVNLVGMVVTPEFQANFGESSYKYVLLYSLAINMVIFEIFNKKKTNFTELKGKICKLWDIFKKNPSRCVVLVILTSLFLWIFVVSVGYIFGLTLNTTT